jgi:hypothetical protein
MRYAVLLRKRESGAEKVDELAPTWACFCRIDVSRECTVEIFAKRIRDGMLIETLLSLLQRYPHAFRLVCSQRVGWIAF